jgi:hypothetical protein
VTAAIDTAAIDTAMTAEIPTTTMIATRRAVLDEVATRS